MDSRARSPALDAERKDSIGSRRVVRVVDAEVKPVISVPGKKKKVKKVSCKHEKRMAKAFSEMFGKIALVTRHDIGMRQQRGDGGEGG